MIITVLPLQTFFFISFTIILYLFSLSTMLNRPGKSSILAFSLWHRLISDMKPTCYSWNVPFGLFFLILTYGYFSLDFFSPRANGRDGVREMLM